MANIAAARIQREFKEVVKSEEVTYVFIGEQKYSSNKCYFQFEFPREKKNRIQLSRFLDSLFLIHYSQQFSL